MATNASFRWLGLAVALVACKAEEPDASGTKAAAASDAPVTETREAAADPGPAAMGDAKVAEPKLRAAMGAHFARAVSIEQSVIDGDLEQAKSDADWIAAQQLEQDMPEAWRPQLSVMVAAAGQVAAAQDLPSAARATGELIASCGGCHQALGAGPGFPEPVAVAEGETTIARMQRHRWAASRMREGIVGPSPRHWELGAASVSVAPPDPCPIPDAEILAPEILNLREQIYDIGAKAAATHDAAGRAKVYGEFLTTCAGCHVGGC